jgi:hypothetical protein
MTIEVRGLPAKASIRCSLAHVFEPFSHHQILPTSTGTGLRAQSICKDHGAEARRRTLAVESTVGQGSVFRITFSENHGVRLRQRSRADRVERIPGCQGGVARAAIRVLIVDDEPRICNVLARLLGDGTTISHAQLGLPPRRRHTHRRGRALHL